MNLAAVAMVERMMEDVNPDFSLKNTVKGLLAVSLVAAVPIGGVALIESHRMTQLETVSASFGTVSEAQTALRASHAGGVASGLLIGGVHVPQELVDRVEEIVATEVVESSNLLSRVRLNGLEEALSGGWNVDRLEEYVARIESEDPALRQILSEETGRLSETGVPEERARVVLRAMAVKLMTGEAPEEFQAPRRVEPGVEAAHAEILQEAQTRLVTRLGETSRVGGLDPVLTREVAYQVILRQDMVSALLEAERREAAEDLTP
jgi:hypothetical protein